jgi:aldehyde:ferredoxin oxidoreductase
MTDPNFNFTHLDDEELTRQLDHTNLKDQFVGKLIPCKGCYIACKKRSSLSSSKTALPEYESIALLSTNLGIKNLEDGIKACDLCNAMGLDTMSTGNLISYLMDCYENAAISHEKFDFSIKFGDAEGVFRLIEEIALRKDGLGDLLANGAEKACQELGEHTRQYLRFSKGIGIPAHLPRNKPGIGFGYLHGPNPSDHMKMEHDWIASSPGDLKAFGITITSELYDLDANKVEIARATQIYYSVIDCLSACIFVFAPGSLYSFDSLVDLVNASTGFDLNLVELMKIGESAVQLQKKLFIDFGGADESFISFLSKAIPSGPHKGMKIKKDDFELARRHYYKLWSWDKNGRPTPEILEQLELDD